MRREKFPLISLSVSSYFLSFPLDSSKQDERFLLTGFGGGPSAECNSAIRQITNLRYERYGQGFSPMRLRDGQCVEDFLNDGFAGFFFGFGFVGDGVAVAEDVHAGGSGVLRCDVTAAATESESRVG